MAKQVSNLEKSPKSSRSLVGDIIIIVVTVVVLVSFASLLLSLVFLSQKNDAHFREITEEHIAFLLASLERPLWNYDSLFVSRLGDTFLANDFFVSLTIRDAGGNEVYVQSKLNGQMENVREKEVVYEGERVGSVSIGLTKSWYEKQQKDILRIGGAIIAAVTISLFIVVFVVIRRFIGKPLVGVSERISATAGGDYRSLDIDVKHLELQGIVDNFNLMVRDIRMREQGLIEANTKLQEEIAERAKVENLLRESRHRYRSLMNNIPVGMFRTTPDGQVINLNRPFREMLAIKEARDFRGLHASDFYVDPRERERMVEEVERKGEIQGFECQLASRRRHRPWVAIAARGIRDENGRLQLIDGIVEDISTRKKAEAEKERLQTQLIQAQKMQAVGTLAGGIAHDFNNILTAILGYNQLAELAIKEPEKLAPLLSGGQEAIRRAQNLVKQILAFSRQGAQEKQLLCLDALLLEVVELLRQTIPKTIQIDTHIDSRWMVMVDPTQMHQVVMNLGTNAYQAMGGRNGILSVLLEDVNLDSSLVMQGSTVPSGKYVVITFKDTGRGMTAETMRKMFEPFFTTKQVGEGTGLGLSVVHGIVSDHSGYIGVESEPEKGTTFKIYIPVSEYAVHHSPSPASEDERNWLSGDERILFVDDERTLLGIAKLAFENYGYTIATFYDPLEALAHFESNNHFDVVVTDMTMPKMTGLELFARIRAVRPEIKTLLCSGYSELIDEDRARARGFSDFVEKPYQMRDLIGKIRDVLDG